MKVLILGGTSESRALAASIEPMLEFDLVTSLAGRVADPTLPVGRTRIGGFGGRSGLAKYLRDNDIDALVDATHPFADAISAHAVDACATIGVPAVAFVRPPWTRRPGDLWSSVASVPDAAAALAPGERVFLTVGRGGLHHFAHLDRTWFLVRVIDPPTGPTPPLSTQLLARGPFEVEKEIALMREHRIDRVVTKNSGGTLTDAKLDAARALSIPVVMIERPVPRAVGSEIDTVDTVEAAVAWLRSSLRQNQPG